MVVGDWAGRWQADGQREEFVLLDRRTERAAIDRVLDAVRSGFCGTLVLRGGPGVGNVRRDGRGPVRRAGLRRAARTGERARARTPHTIVNLTPQEDG